MRLIKQWWASHITDMEAVREDGRKFGMAVVIAGFAGYFSDNVGTTNASILTVVGLVIWLFGVRIPRNKK